MGKLNAPARAVVLSDGRHDVKFTTRRLMALEDAYGSWDELNTAWDAKEATHTAALLAVALDRSADECVELLDGVGVRPVKVVLIAAINDALGGPKIADPADPTTPESPSPGANS